MRASKDLVGPSFDGTRDFTVQRLSAVDGERLLDVFHPSQVVSDQSLVLHCAFVVEDRFEVLNFDCVNLFSAFEDEVRVAAAEDVAGGGDGGLASAEQRHLPVSIEPDAQ